MTAKNSSSTNLLEVFNSIEVNNEEKISQSDLAFCREQQQMLENVLARLDKWYQLFRKEAESLDREEYNLTFKPDGTVNYREPYRNSGSFADTCKRQDFLPFDSLNKIADKRRNLIECFANCIVRHFNNTYDLSVPLPDTGRETLAIDFVPAYVIYVDAVIAHLGGRGFRETAEEELVSRVQRTVHRYDRHSLPEIKSKSIVFHDLFRFDSFSLQYGTYKIPWGDIGYVNTLCAGLAFYGQDRLNGDYGIICGFSKENVNITDCYELSTFPAEYMKFYKNGRVDVKFKDTASAEECFKKLKLDEL